MMDPTNFHYYKAIIAYDGTNYFGWQSQPCKNTIQDNLLKALSDIQPNSTHQVVGCGRTDSGVHAHKQVISIRTDKYMQPGSLKKALNTKLDPSIRLMEVELVDSKFHPLQEIKRKEYQYFFSCDSELDPCLRHYVLSYPFSLDIEKMIDAAQCFVGEFDFSNFSNAGSDVSNSTRRIGLCELKILPPQQLFLLGSRTYSIYALTISGNGFLKQMVRNIMGSLLMVGRGKLEIADLEQALNLSSVLPYKYCAPASGLHQMDVEYLPLN